ncbi:MAG: exodeoxyribonuclease V subunit gamma, partial [Gemmatimonadales bacterium]|nr:exodeoxyribonuclease V subunit gamma [Gemmatimonadales bacterium]
RQRAGFEFGDLGAIRHLVESVGVHWGIDGAHREARFGLPPEEGATWREGLSRLQLQRVAASDALEPDITTTQIDRLTAWFERLVRAEAIVAMPHSIAEWQVIVDTLISDFLTTWSSDDAEVMSGLRRSIEHLVTSSAAARVDATLPLTAIGQELEHILTETATSGDLRGGLRVCALAPGMVLPARVVMIAGLDDAQFPRGGGVPTWDILLQSRLDNDHDPLEAEDPDPREDALDAFRDAVRSASDALHISWVGRSMMDNAERAPSVAVSELLDIVGQVAENAGVVINEPLQPFAEELFAPGAINQSGSRRWADVAAALQAPAAPSQFASPLPAPIITTIRLDDLADAMRDPIKWHWTKVLALPTPGSDADDEDTEPVLNEDHDDFGLNRALLDLARSSTPITADAVRSRTAAGLGTIADVAVAARILPAAAALEAATNQPANRSIPVRLELGGYTIEGSLDRVSTEGQLLIIWWPSSARSLLGEWVRHLALCAVAPEGVDLRTRIVGVGRKPEQLHAEFRSVSNAREILGTLCRLYAALSANAIPAFPRSAFKYAVAKLKEKDAAKAAYDCWAGGYMSEAEGGDPIAARLFPERVLDEEHDPEFWRAFTQYADAVAVPMIAHLDSVLTQ